MQDALRKILVVEDEAELREIVVSLLEGDHFAVDQAENGTAALALLETQKYALVLSDIQMPGMTGLELFAQAKAKGHVTPFVFLTAFGDQENIMKALRLGAFDFVKKPFDETEVRDVVRRAAEIGHRRLEIERDLDGNAELDAEKLKKDGKMIRLLEMNNYRKRG